MGNFNEEKSVIVFYKIGWNKFQSFFTLIIFVYVFNISHPIWNQDSIKFNFFPDSSGYINTIYFDPWEVYRTPGYPLICALFFSPEKRMIKNKVLEGKTRAELFGKNGKVEKILSNNDLESSFFALVMFQRIVQALAISFFFFALCEFFPSLFSLCAVVLGLWVVPPANPYDVLTEPVAQSLLFICLACLFFYKSRKNFLWLYLATTSALISWMVRPVCLFMIGICFICCIYFFYVNHFYSRINYCINIFLLLLPPAIYIAYLSFSVGGLLVSPLQDLNDLGRVLFFLEEEDLKNMPTHRSKLFAQAFLDNYPNFVIESQKVYEDDLLDRESPHSLPYRYRYLASPYIYVGSRYPYKVIGKVNSILQRNIFVKELHWGIMKRHFADNMKLNLANFLSSFGFYKDLEVSNVIIKFNSRIYALGLGLLIGMIVFSTKGRYVLILLLMVHLGNLVVCATHLADPRYIGFTEIFICVAIILALLNLMKTIILFLVKFITRERDFIVGTV